MRLTTGLSLALPREAVVANVRATSPSTPSTASQPGYMSVPPSGDHAGYFTVYTYAGHHHRSARGTWSATGTGPFAAAFSIPNEASTFDAVFQQDWTSLSGLYRFVSR